MLHKQNLPSTVKHYIFSTGAIHRIDLDRMATFNRRYWASALCRAEEHMNTSDDLGDKEGVQHYAHVIGKIIRQSSQMLCPAFRHNIRSTLNWDSSNQHDRETMGQLETDILCVYLDKGTE